MSTPTFEETLEHYGVKGMRWGVRRSKKQIARDNAKRADEGKKVTPSKEAKAARAAAKKAKEQGLDTLSNDELNKLNKRMNLERQYNQMTKERSTLEKGMNTAKTVLAVGATVNGAIAFAKSPAGQAVRKVIAGA